MPYEDLLDQPIEIVSRTWANARGTRTIASESFTPLMAAVQPMTPSRAHRYGVEAEQSGWTIYVAPPAPLLAVGDLIRWRGRTLTVLAAPQDQAGRGEVLAIPAAEVK